MLIRILVFSFTAFLAWLIHEVNTGSRNFIIQMVDSIPIGDKIGHFLLMGMLAYLVNLLMECKTFKLGKWQILTGSVIVAVCVLIEEMTQIFIPTRTFSYLDLLSDLLGILTFSYLAVKTHPTIAQWLDRLSRPEGYGRSST